MPSNACVHPPLPDAFAAVPVTVPELQTVPSLAVVPSALNFLGLQVFVSGSVNPKYPGPSASQSMK